MLDISVPAGGWALGLVFDLGWRALWFLRVRVFSHFLCHSKLLREIPP
jgi:hypothetical protein